MKKNNYFLMLATLAVFGFAGCSDSNEPSDTQEKETWITYSSGIL